MKGQKKPGKIISRHKALMKECDALWSECIKARAGYKSEYCVHSDHQILNAHHIAGKPNLRLRYELENGVCLTWAEHNYIAHNAGRQEKFRKFIKDLRGEKIFDRLEKLSWYCCKSDLSAVKVYLTQKLADLKVSQDFPAWKGVQ